LKFKISELKLLSEKLKKTYGKIVDLQDLKPKFAKSKANSSKSKNDKYKIPKRIIRSSKQRFTNFKKNSVLLFKSNHWRKLNSKKINNITQLGKFGM